MLRTCWSEALRPVGLRPLQDAGKPLLAMFAAICNNDLDNPAYSIRAEISGVLLTVCADLVTHRYDNQREWCREHREGRQEIQGKG